LDNTGTVQNIIMTTYIGSCFAYKE